MKKIPTLFNRNPETRSVLATVNPLASWVFDNSDALPTRKFDGTCCLIRDGKFFKRYEVKRDKLCPANFIPCTCRDPITGKIQGWMPVTESPDDQFHRAALARGQAYADISLHQLGEVLPLDDGTYELIGPKIQGNPEGSYDHVLIRHGCSVLYPVVARLHTDDDLFYKFNWLRHYLSTHTYEGIVWHHPDGRMAKLKRKDFGMETLPIHEEQLPTKEEANDATKKQFCLWMEDDATRHDPDRETVAKAWLKLFGEAIPCRLDSFDLGDCFAQYYGRGRWVLQSFDGDSIYQTTFKLLS